MKKFLAVLLALVLVFGLAACGSKSGGKTGELGFPKVVTVYIPTAEGAMLDQSSRIMVDFWRQQFPDVKFNIENSTGSGNDHAKIVADAPTSYDTLKEIADWISSHADSASAMNSAIVALQAKTLLGSYNPGTYTVTEDTEAVANKTYYTRSGESPDYTYTEVTGLTAGDDISSAGYYEADEPVEYSTVKAYVEAYVAAQLGSSVPSISVASASGAGNVLTALSYNNGVFTPTMGVTAITTADLVDLTDEEVAALFVPETTP